MPPQIDPTLPQWAQDLLRRQLLTAQAIADLALGLDAQAKSARSRHDELTGLIFALLTKEETKRNGRALTAVKREREPSAKLILPGLGRMEITSKGWKKAGVVLGGLAGVSGWIVHVLHALHILH